MNQKDYLYWLIPNAFNDDLCQRILNLSNGKFEKALIQDVEEIDKIRDSSIVWTNEQWLYNIVFDYVKLANKWQMNISGAENMQITKYAEKGFYNFHKDGSGFNTYNYPENKVVHDKTRKLSMTALLNDDFEGGEFQFYNDEPIKMNKGDIIFFPSFEFHRVLPISKGVRHSLVTWFVGPTLK